MGILDVFNQIGIDENNDRLQVIEKKINAIAKSLDKIEKFMEKKNE